MTNNHNYTPEKHNEQHINMSFIFQKELPEDKKRELIETAHAVVENTQHSVQEYGSMEGVVSQIESVGRAYIHEASLQQLDNDLLRQKLDVLEGFHDKTYKDLTTYQEKLGDLSFEKNLRSKNPIVRTIHAMPFAHPIRKRLFTKFKNKVQSAEGFIKEQIQTFKTTIQELEDANKALDQERENNAKNIEKYREYLFLLEEMKKKYNEYIKVLKAENNAELDFYASKIEEEILTAIEIKIEQFNHQIAAAQTIVHTIIQSKRTNNQLIKQVERNVETGIPIIKNTLLVTANAQRAEYAIDMIKATNAFTNEATKNLGHMIKRVDKALHQIENTQPIEVQTLIGLNQTIQNLEKENEQRRKDRLKIVQKRNEDFKKIQIELEKADQAQKLAAAQTGVEIAQELIKENENKAISHSSDIDLSQL